MQQARVRIVVQNRESALYFKGAEEWTAELDEAADFKQVAAAFDFILQTRMMNLDIILNSYERECDVRIQGTPPTAT